MTCATKGRPTLKTIAELTGLAVPTVSRALSGAQDIGPATRARVRQVADDLGYVPNRAGVRLRTGRSYVISLVLPTQMDVMALNGQLISSVAGALRDTRYSLTITPYFPQDDPLDAVRTIVSTQAADAIILNQIEPQDARVAYLMDKGIPFVTHGRSEWAGRHDYYDFDNAAYAQMAVARLAGRGRRHLALLAPPERQSYARDMIAGAEQAARAHGVTLKVFRGLTSDSPAHRIETDVTCQLQAAQRAGQPVDGMIFGSASACMAAVAAAEAAGHVIGADIDLYAKEAAPFLHWFRADIMTQPEDAQAAGAFLARAAVQRIEAPQSPLMQHLERPVTLDA